MKRRFWQDATDRSIPGITEPVDTDWFDGTRAELEAFAGAARARASHPRRAPRGKAPAKARRRKRAAPPVVDVGGLLSLLPI